MTEKNLEECAMIAGVRGQVCYPLLCHVTFRCVSLFDSFTTAPFDVTMTATLTPSAVLTLIYQSTRRHYIPQASNILSAAGTLV